MLVTGISTSLQGSELACVDRMGLFNGSLVPCNIGIKILVVEGFLFSLAKATF